MKVYLDACVLNRLSDDRTQQRIRKEAEAVEEIFRSIFLGEIEWSASVAVELEVSRNPNLEKRQDALVLLTYAGPLVEATAEIAERAEELYRLGYGAADGLHLAFAEADHVDILLTTDDRFLRQAARGLGRPLVRVANPVNWK